MGGKVIRKPMANIQNNKMYSLSEFPNKFLSVRYSGCVENFLGFHLNLFRWISSFNENVMAKNVCLREFIEHPVCTALPTIP